MVEKTNKKPPEFFIGRSGGWNYGNVKLITFYHFLERQAEYQVACVAGDCAFVLSPKEWPIVVVFKMVGLAKQDAGRHIAGDEGEVGAVVAVKY